MNARMNLSFPKILSIQTTSLCNAHCTFCPYEQIKDIEENTLIGERV